MKNFFENYIMYVIALILVLVIVLAFVVYSNNSNQSITTGSTRFTWAIIQLGNGELIEGEVTAWRHFDKSDMIQVTIDDNLTLLTHATNVILCNHEP